MTLGETAPEFTTLLHDLLAAEEETIHAKIVNNLEIIRCVKSNDENLYAFYIYVKDPRASTAINESEYGDRYKDSIAVTDLSNDYILDIDESGTIMSIEVLGREDVYKQIQLKIGSA